MKYDDGDLGWSTKSITLVFTLAFSLEAIFDRRLLKIDKLAVGDCL